MATHKISLGRKNLNSISAGLKTCLLVSKKGINVSDELHLTYPQSKILLRFVVTHKEKNGQKELLSIKKVETL